jgi:hypothetical protein
MAKLTITSGPDKGREFPLGDSQVLGRLPRCTIPLKDTRASREHARIYRGEGGWSIVDLDSKNGIVVIVVNGQQVRKAQLSTGDEIQIGDTWCKIELDEAASAAEAPAAGRGATPAGASPLGSSTTAGVMLRGKDGKATIKDEPIRTGGQKSGRSGGSVPTRTSLAWLRSDLSQASMLYRLLMLVGVAAIALGLGWFVWRLTSGGG